MRYVFSIGDFLMLVHVLRVLFSVNVIYNMFISLILCLLLCFYFISVFLSVNVFSVLQTFCQHIYLFPSSGASSLFLLHIIYVFVFFLVFFASLQTSRHLDTLNHFNMIHTHTHTHTDTLRNVSALSGQDKDVKQDTFFSA